MDWSHMLKAPIVVFGCGNILFGDDGLAPKAVSALAEKSSNTGILTQVAFIDAGTSIRPLLLDMILQPAQAQKVILVDVVQEAGRTLGSIQQKILDDESHYERYLSDPSGDFLHNAPTWALLHALHSHAKVGVVVVTIQAARIPVLMDDTLSREAQDALPALLHTIKDLCTLSDSE
ncbi:MAG: hydrogenase maturation protease [Desulfovibrionaceae bacterium]